MVNALLNNSGLLCCAIAYIKWHFKKIIIVLELIDVFNRLCAWNFYLVEGRAACQEDKNKSREALTWQIHLQGLPGFRWRKLQTIHPKSQKGGTLSTCPVLAGSPHGGTSEPPKKPSWGKTRPPSPVPKLCFGREPPQRGQQRADESRLSNLAARV